MPHPDRIVVQDARQARRARPGPPPRGRRAVAAPTGRGRCRNPRQRSEHGGELAPRGRPARCRAAEPDHLGRLGAQGAQRGGGLRCPPPASAARDGMPRCERSPSVTATSRSRAPDAAEHGYRPPAPSTSSSGCAATITALGTPRGRPARRQEGCAATARQPRSGSRCLARRWGWRRQARSPGGSRARRPLTEPRQVAFGVMLAQVDRQVGDRAGVRLVVTERPRPQRPARPGQHVVAAASVSARTRRARRARRRAGRPGRRRSRRAARRERGPRRAQGDVDGAQVRQRVRADVALGGGASSVRATPRAPPYQQAATPTPPWLNPGRSVYAAGRRRPAGRRPRRSRRPACRFRPSRWRARCPALAQVPSMATANSRVTRRRRPR